MATQQSSDFQITGLKEGDVSAPMDDRWRGNDVEVVKTLGGTDGNL